MGTKEVGLWSRSGIGCGFRETICEWQVRQPDRAMSCAHEQIGVRGEVGVQA